MKIPYSISLEKEEVTEIKEMADRLNLPPRTLARAILLRGLRRENVIDPNSNESERGIRSMTHHPLFPFTCWKLKGVSKAVLCPQCRNVYLSDTKIEKCRCGTPIEPCQIIEIDFVNEESGPIEAAGPIPSIKVLDGESVERGSETE